MNYLDAFLWREQLVRRYADQDGFNALKLWADHHVNDKDIGFTSPRDSKVLADLFKLSAVALGSAVPFFVADEVMPLVYKGSARLTEGFTLNTQLVLRNSGFVFFETPVRLEHGNIPIVALSWHPMWSTGIMPVTGVHDVEIDDDDYIQIWFWGHPHFPKILPLPFAAFRVGFKDPLTQLDRAIIKTFEIEGSKEKLRLFAALLLFMDQRILERQVMPVPRPLRHRALSPEDSKTIQVIRLRRVVKTGTPHSQVFVDWQWRWVVSGHWRNQYFPSRKSHLPRWITPYLKGPQTKPLRLRDGVTFQVDR